jgi:hypothetical protein
MNDPISEGDLREIRDAIFAGRKIEAIKLYRQYTRQGLKEAKDAVEDLEKKLRSESPERFLVDEPEGGTQPETKSPKTVPGVQTGKGCFGVLAVIVATAIFALLVVAARH